MLPHSSLSSKNGIQVGGLLSPLTGPLNGYYCGVQTVHTEDLRLTPSTHSRWFTTLCNSSSSPDTLLWPPGVYALMYTQSLSAD